MALTQERIEAILVIPACFWRTLNRLERFEHAFYAWPAGCRAGLNPQGADLIARCMRGPTNFAWSKIECLEGSLKGEIQDVFRNPGIIYLFKPMDSAPDTIIRG